MNDLDQALGEISSIRRQMARSTQFRGYGPATLAATGLVALLAACLQTLWAPDSQHYLSTYLSIWIGAAILSASLTGVQMYTRTRRMHSGLSHDMLRMAVEQFLPCAAAGLPLTIVLLHFVPAALWMLPGLWQLIFSLGVFSSCRFLPRPMLAAGAWYLITGLVCIALGDGRALSPWAMGAPFAFGQMLTAGVLLVASPGGVEEGADEA